VEYKPILELTVSTGSDLPHQQLHYIYNTVRLNGFILVYYVLSSTSAMLTG